MMIAPNHTAQSIHPSPQVRGEFAAQGSGSWDVATPFGVMAAGVACRMMALRLSLAMQIPPVGHPFRSMHAACGRRSSCVEGTVL